MGTKIGNSYHDTLYDPERLMIAVEKTIAKARKIYTRTPFDTIAFRGSSGAAMAFPLSLTLQIPCIYVRKPNEQSHGNRIEGPWKVVHTYLIIDDFISEGKTIKAIVDALPELSCIGALMYARTTEDIYWHGSKFQIPLWGSQ